MSETQKPNPHAWRFHLMSALAFMISVSIFLGIELKPTEFEPVYPGETPYTNYTIADYGWPFRYESRCLENHIYRADVGTIQVFSNNHEHEHGVKFQFKFETSNFAYDIAIAFFICLCVTALTESIRRRGDRKP